MMRLSSKYASDGDSFLEHDGIMDIARKISNFMVMCGASGAVMAVFRRSVLYALVNGKRRKG